MNSPILTNQVTRYRMEASIHEAAPNDSESHFAMVAPVEALNGEWVKWEDVKRLLYVEPTKAQAIEPRIFRGNGPDCLGCGKTLPEHLTNYHFCPGLPENREGAI